MNTKQNCLFAAEAEPRIKTQLPIPDDQIGGASGRLAGTQFLAVRIGALHILIPTEALPTDDADYADGNTSSRPPLINNLPVHVLPHPICKICVIYGHLNPSVPLEKNIRCRAPPPKNQRTKTTDGRR